MAHKPGKHFVFFFFTAVFQYFFPFIITCICNLGCAAVRIINIYISDGLENIVCQIKRLSITFSFKQCIHFIYQIVLQRPAKIQGIPVINVTPPVTVLPYKLVYALFQPIHLFLIYLYRISGHKCIPDLAILRSNPLYKGA